MTRFFLPLLGLAALIAGAATGQTNAKNAPARPAAAPGTVQDLIVFTADGPLRVRLVATLNGGGTEAVWKAGVDALFTFCDKNNNGKLEPDERQLIQNMSRNNNAIYSGLPFNGPYQQQAGGGPQIQFDDKKKVDRAELRSVLAAASLGPVSVDPVAPRQDSQQLTDALFKRLDTDGDGKLSLAELKAARTRLAAVDTNEDEILTADELLNRFQNQFYAFNSFDGFGGRMQGPPPLPEVLTGPAGRPLAGKDVIASRDKDDDKVLTAAELGCDAKLFAELDADGNGQLDSVELDAWLRRPPDVELSFDLTDVATARPWLPIPGANPMMPADPAKAVRVLGKGRLADKVKPTAEGGFALDLRDARFRFAADVAAAAATRQQWEDNAANYRSLFEQFAGKRARNRGNRPPGGAADTTGVVDFIAGVFDSLPAKKGEPVELDLQRANEEGELAQILQFLQFADRNGNNKVTRVELDQAIATTARLTNCRVGFTVADQGRGLFELLDRDGDGRLSPREQAAAPALLALLDRDGDGKVSRSELPRGYSITARVVSIDVQPNNNGFGGDIAVDVSGQPMAAPITRGAVDAPDWFLRMDRNGDGDVSAREFAGPPALFKRIDTDGDGLISPEEARAFEKMSAKAKGK